MRMQLKYCVQCQLSRFNHVGGQAGKAKRGNMWFAFQQSYENVAQKFYGLIRHLSCGGCFLQFMDNLLVVNFCQFKLVDRFNQISPNLFHFIFAFSLSHLAKSLEIKVEELDRSKLKLTEKCQKRTRDLRH